MAGIGIFGGTFNPPHMGHLRLVRCFADRLSLSKIMIIPTFIPPHKDAPLLAPADERLEMCRLMFGSERAFEISDIELRRKGKSYTYDTLLEIKKLYPGEPLYLIIGSDMYESFDSWYRADDILKLCTLCVASRDDDTHLLRRENVIIDTMEPLEISSTELREKIRRGENVSELVGDDVMEYILRKGLYK